MGFNFRKSINLGKGLRANVSKSGIGFSWGVKGFRISRSAKGKVKATASLPGTGLSYTQDIPVPGSESSKKKASSKSKTKKTK